MSDVPRGETRDLFREVEKAPIAEVVRSFVLKLKTKKEVALSLSSGVAPEDLYFVGSLFMHKSGAENSGQLMPVGGKVETTDTQADKRKTLRRAMKRELLEETHLRSYKSEEIGLHRYSFEHSGRGERIQTEAAFFVDKVLPSDIPYALDPKADKFKEFVNLDLNRVAGLVSEHQVTLDSGETASILDSFIINDEARLAANPRAKTEVDADSVAQVLGGFLEKMQGEEMEAKRQILLSLLLLKFSSEDGYETENFNFWKNRVIQVDNFYDIQNLYVEILKKFKVSPEEILEAVNYNNLAVEMEHTGNSRPEATLRFMVTLFMAKEWSDLYFMYAEENEQIAKMLVDLNKLMSVLEKKGVVVVEEEDDFYKRLTRIHELVNQWEEEDTDETEMAESRKIISDEEVQEIFKQAFGLKNEPAELADLVDNFIAHLAEESVLPYVERHYGTAGVNQEEKVSGNDFLSLLKLAVYKPDNQRLKQKYPDAANRKMVIFEARRKLVLILLAEEVKNFYDEEIKKGKVPIVKLWKKFTDDPTEVTHRIPIYKKDDEGKYELDAHDIRILTDVIFKDEGELDEDERENSEKVELSKMHLPSGVCTVEILPAPTKSVDSVLRKYIVQGSLDVVMDINRRTIIFHPNGETDENMFEFVESEVTYSALMQDLQTGKYEEEERRIKVRESRAVLEIMQKIVEEGKGQVKIVSYRPSSRMDTHGPGGNPNLHFAKFYIQHTDEKGQKRMQEVQIFVPQEGRSESPSWFHAQKLLDDKRFGFERLTDTKGLRSFVELMWPAEIYGEQIASLHRKSPDGRKKKR